MANKNVNESVVERRLKPIYEWLDNGNNKKAIQEADKVLRKQPNLQCATVLKSLALLRLGRAGECSELIKSVTTEGTADDATLQALTIYFREIQEPEMVCSIYEKAAKLDPSNEEIMSHLFMAYVRVGDYKKQQQTAMQLYKCKPKNPYYFWAVMSIVMQAQVTKDLVSKRVSLQLAERMVVKKFDDENRIESEAEILTYFYILEIQGKYAQALEAIQGYLVKKIQQQPRNFIALKKASYHFHLEQYREASELYKYVILSDPDNWQHYVSFIDSVLKMRGEEISLGAVDPLIDASMFLQNQRKKAENNSNAGRSPHLCLLQFCLRLKEEGLEVKATDYINETASDLLYDFISLFGHKMCCFTDLVNFLPLISFDEAPSLLDRVEGLISWADSTKKVPLNVENVYRHLIHLQLRQALRPVTDVSSNENKEMEYAEKLILLYLRTLPLSGNVPLTDIRPNDAYLLVAAHIYYSRILDLVSESRSSCLSGQDTIVSRDEGSSCPCPAQLLIKMCAFLEFGSKNSRTNFQLKLLLIKAYNLVGAIEASYRVCEHLDLKQIQLDTLSYIIALHLTDFGNFSSALSFYSSTLRFFISNSKDTTEPLLMSYKFGSLVRIPEFVEFRERLNNSLQFAIVRNEKVIVEITSLIHCRSQLEAFYNEMAPYFPISNWDDLADNRDLFVMNSWQPHDRRLSALDIKTSLEDEKAMLKVREATVGIIYSCLRCCYNEKSLPSSSNVVTNGSPLTNGDAVSGDDQDDSLSKFKASLESFSSVAGCLCESYQTKTPPTLPLAGPDVSRIYYYSRGRYFSVLLGHAELLMAIKEESLGSSSRSSKSMHSLKFDSLREDWRKCIDFHLSKLKLLQLSARKAVPNVNNLVLFHLSHFVQTVSLALIFAEGMSRLLHPSKAATTGKKTKAKKSVREGKKNENMIQFNTFISYLESQLENFIQELTKKIDSRSKPVENLSRQMTVTNLDATKEDDRNHRDISSGPNGQYSLEKFFSVDFDLQSSAPNWIEKVILNIENSLEKNLRGFISLLNYKINFLNVLKL